MSQNLLSDTVVIGALRVKFIVSFSIILFQYITWRQHIANQKMTSAQCSYQQINVNSILIKSIFQQRTNITTN